MMRNDGNRLRRAEGYRRVLGRDVQTHIILAAIAGLLALAVLYVALLHPLVVGYVNSRQSLPTFAIGSSGIDGYSGKLRIVDSRDNIVYEGGFANGKAEGVGRLYDGGSLVYEGGFSSSTYFGNGVLYDENQSIAYVGEFANNAFNGSGTAYSGGKVVYVGEFKDGVYSGDGLLFSPSGTLIYEGEFADGLYNGNGKLRNASGALVYEGAFLNGEFSGYGTEYNPANGQKVFEGVFKDGKRTLDGTRYDDGNAQPSSLPRLVNPVDFLGESYVDVCRELIRAGVSYRLLPSPDGLTMIVDDTQAVIYVFINDAQTGTAEALRQVYLCGLSSTDGVTVGGEVSDTTLSMTESVLPGALDGRDEQYALALSNAHWQATRRVSELGCVRFAAGARLVSVYYEPSESDTIEAPSGKVAFLRVELSSHAANVRVK